MSGMFEVLAASDDEQKIAAQEVQDKLAAAVYDVRQEFGDFLFKAADIHEFRTRVHLVRPDMMKVVDRHVPPTSGVMGKIARRRGSILEKEFFARQAAVQKGAPFAGYDDFDDCTSKNADKGDSSAYCGEIKHKVEGSALSGLVPQAHVAGLIDSLTAASTSPDPALAKYAGWHTATGDGPALDTNETYHEESGPLIPEGNWPGFENSVDQTSQKVDDHVFVPGEHDKTYTVDTGANFVPGSHEGSAYTDRTLGPGMDPDEARGGYADEQSRQNGEQYQRRLHEKYPFFFDEGDKVQASVQKLLLRYVGFCRRNQLPLSLVTLERHGKLLSPDDYLVIAANLNRIAAPDFLQKAKDALEGLLNQKAEDFQKGLAPLQQAYQVIQQSQAIEQAQNPLAVQPPAGTVNVLPDAPQGLPGAGDPAAGGGMADQSAPPPAAGMTPIGPDPQQMSARRRGGHPKGQRPVKAGV